VDREGNTNVSAHCVAESARIICRGGVQPRPRIDYNQPMPLDRLQRARDDDKADTVRYTADVPIGPHDEVASGARAALLARLQAQPVVEIRRWTREELYEEFYEDDR
jgi:hypothetical protein